MAAGGPPVAINARAAVRREIGGVERMARELVRHLPALRPDRYRVVRPPSALAHRAGHLWEQAALPALAGGARLILSPANLAPLLSRRNVVVLHDAAALRHPEAYSREYVAYQRRLLPALARRARLLVTVSEFSRREIGELLGVDAAGVVVVPEGVDERFSPEADPAPARSAHGLTGDYVLAVGTPSARKNPGWLGALAPVLAARGLELVVAGSDRGYLRGGVPGPRRLGYVAEDHLPGLYAGARAFVMPSRYEGFGLPVLEAMASGVPVVAARAGALPETVAEAGLLADDEAGFCDAAVAAIGNDAVRSRLVEAGLARARAFTWERTARQLDAALDAVLERSERGARVFRGA